MSVSRRDFIGAGAAAAASLALPGLAAAAPGITVRERSESLPSAESFAGRPVIISASNGFRSKDNGVAAIQKAYTMMVGGADPLDAIVAGVQVVELDPNDQSVGLGGLPNEEGVVQLDASCMHGPTRRAGAVGALEGIATPAAVAKAVLEYTDHIFLVGAGAKKFALEMGFKEQNLLTEQSRRDWLRWKAKLNSSDNWLDPVADSVRARPPAGAVRPPEENPAFRGHVYYDSRGIPYTYGTINMNAVNANGDIASVTTTSGLSWKIPGRVGDSPIVGAGQYCDNDVGAAGSTGRGEANIKVCGAFLAVEFMRQGMAPQQALMKVMERVIAMTEKRLLDDKGRPYFQLEYYAVNKKGEYACACAYEGSDFAVADAKGARTEMAAYMFKKAEQPKGPLSGVMIKP